jgi:excisionase family DNA binding protein
LTSATTHTPSPSDLTVREVAEELNACTRFVHDRIRDGQLPAIKYGTRFIRIRRVDLDAFRARHTTTTTPAQERANLLGEETVQAVAESAAAAGPFTEQQADTVRAAFRGSKAEPPKAKSKSKSKPVHIPASVRQGGRNGS